MAYYKFENLLRQEFGGEFDLLHRPSDITPHSGIYTCANCGGSAVSTLGHPLPPQGHHTHTDNRPILWQLAVKAHWR